VTYDDGEVVESTSGVLCSSLWLQSSLMRCIALEIRLLYESRQLVRAEALVEAIFGVPSSQDTNSPDVRIPGQPLTRILQMLDTLSFRWEDGIVLPSVSLQLFDGINWETCLRTDDRGCQVYDVRLLNSTLKTARVRLQKSGSLSSPVSDQQLRLETEFILKSAATENHRREIKHALEGALGDWASLLEVTLTCGFAALSSTTRESALHDLLLALPAHITDASQSTSSLLSPTYLSLIHNLHLTVAKEALLSSRSLSLSYPFAADRFHIHLKKVLECIIMQGTSERTRGYLYTSLLRHLQALHNLEGICPTATQSTVTSSRGNFDRISAQHVANAGILNAVADRLIPIVCRDALDGAEVWRTVALSLLGSLVQETCFERTSRVLFVLVREGYLAAIVQSLGDSTLELLKVIQPYPSAYSLYSTTLRVAVHAFRRFAQCSVCS
jgi:nuclear pore complex protein Nup205